MMQERGLMRCSGMTIGGAEYTAIDLIKLAALATSTSDPPRTIMIVVNRKGLELIRSAFPPGAAVEFATGIRIIETDHFGNDEPIIKRWFAGTGYERLHTQRPYEGGG